MDRELFADRFRASTIEARRVAKLFVEEDLPQEIRLRVALNSSYDGNPLHPDEHVYPEDGEPEKRLRLARCTLEEAIDLLWRDGAVPEWINLSVVSVSRDATVIEAACCGRYTANEQLLYHTQEGRSPFHVLGPSLPVQYPEGQKFSIHTLATCLSRGDLDELLPHSSKVWSLGMVGPELDELALAGLPPFRVLELLELREMAVRGPGLASLGRHPMLRVLRVRFANDDPASLETMPRLPRLETLELHDLPAGSSDPSALAGRLPRLSWLSISGRGEIRFERPWSRRLGHLSLRADRVRGNPVPRSVESLGLHLSDSDDAELERWLARVKGVKHLDLHGTPVTDCLVESLVARWALKSLDVVDTRVTAGCVRRIAARYPRLRLYPG